MLGIGVLCGLLAAGFQNIGALHRLESATWAWRAKAFAGRGAATDRIRVILLDQESLDWGVRVNAWPWPWPREVYGAILDFCRRGGAKAVAFDVLFSEPSYIGPGDDEALGAAIARTPGFVSALFPGTTGEAPDAELLARIGYPGLSIAGASDSPSVSLPVPELRQAILRYGAVQGTPDEDGVYRRMAPFSNIAGSSIPSLGLAAFLAGAQTEPELQESRWGRRDLRIGDRSIPLDRFGRAILRYRGTSATHPTVSAAAVIQSELRLVTGEGRPVIEPEDFRDTYVFFGFSAPGLMDLRPTPVSRIFPGVEIHATFLDNLLSNDFLREPLPWLSGGMAVLLSILISALLLALQRPWQTSLAALFGLALPAGFGFAAYPLGWAWPLTESTLAVLASIGATLVYKYATEGRQKAFIRTAFRHYLSPVVIDRILRDPSQLKLGGERRELSIFFSDLQGFSSLSEKLNPSELTELLNDYLTDMTDIILDEGGTLDKYEGDAIIAFWNAPLPLPDHATLALRAGLRCQRKLAERRAEFQQRCGVELRMRIGIHTGEVVVGNMGSRARFDYSILGDAANLASRLEGANKAFGTYFMVSEATWSATGGAFTGRELARLRVVGRKTPVRVFEPVGEASEPLPPWIQTFSDALSLYADGQPTEAAAIFETLADQDPAARAYAQRLR
ncbi:MAG: adenylate/guanylate cyclase domain-containing protein, partial [Kiritimatiellia bacterium]|nr:adenylate/guanylate cyclase domain-containing protein [Kiritimatiellia bacterium]